MITHNWIVSSLWKNLLFNFRFQCILCHFNETSWAIMALRTATQLFFHLSHDAEMLILISFYCQNLTSPNVQWIFHMYPLLYASSCIGTRATVQNNKSELQYCTYENTKVGSWKQLTCKSSIQKKKKKKKASVLWENKWKQENALLWYVLKTRECNALIRILFEKKNE